METGRRWRHIRVVVPLTLLVMILMRLVWMQIRSYPVTLTPSLEPSIARLVEADFVACGPAASPLAGQTGSGEAPGVASAGTQNTADDAVASHSTSHWNWPQWSPMMTIWMAAGCESERPVTAFWLRANQWLYVLTVLAAVMMTRFLTSSWTLSLAVAAMLMSRGVLLGDLGRAGTDYLGMFLVTLWAACHAHFVRTGSTAILIMAFLTTVAAALVDWTLGALALAMPAVLVVGHFRRASLAEPVLQRFRDVRRRFRQRRQRFERSLAARGEEVIGIGLARVRWALGLEYDAEADQEVWRPGEGRGGLLKTINVPFAVWISAGRRILKLVLSSVACAIVALGLGWTVFIWPEPPVATMSELLRSLGWLYRSQDPGSVHVALRSWFGVTGLPIDLHIMASFVVILVAAMQSPADGLVSFLEIVWLVLLATLLMLGLSLIVWLAQAHTATPAAAAARPVLVWFQPLILSLGVAGVWNLLKIFDARFTRAR